MGYLFTLIGFVAYGLEELISEPLGVSGLAIVQFPIGIFLFSDGATRVILNNLTYSPFTTILFNCI